jgi:hypothetical protein
MKTSRLGSMRPWRVFHRPRLRATPGWFCSLASTVFFEAEAFAADECPDGAVVDPQPAPGKFGHQSAQGERRRRPGDKPRPMGARDLRRHMAANLARRDAILALCGHRFVAGVVDTTTCQDHPGNARQLVGQRNNDNILVRPRKSEPRRHVPSTPKGPGVANGGDQGHGVDRPDPGNRHQASHRLFIPRHLDKLFVKDRNTLVEGTPFGAQVFDQQPNARAQRRDPIFIRESRKLFFQFAPALRRHDPTLQQQRAQMVDQRGALRHQPFARAMQRLNVRLPGS